METFTHLMRAVWQFLRSSSKLSKTSSIATTGSGSHLQCYFSSIVCIQCKSDDPKLRGLEGSIKFWVCDECFSDWFIVVNSSIKNTFYIELVYPFECFILRSPTLADAVKSAIDFNGLNDVNGGRKWKKTLQKR